MPNWINSSIVIKAKSPTVIENFVNSGKLIEGKYYLSSWIPMPQTYKDYDTTNIRSSTLIVGERLFNQNVIVTEELKKEYEEAEKYQRDTYGAIGWYDWSCKYWGTKWDSEVEFDYLPGSNRLDISTDTAWSPPIAFLKEISRRYPEVVIDLKAHDEGGGNWWIYIIDGMRSCDLTEVGDRYVFSILKDAIEKGVITSDKISKEELIKRASSCSSYYDITYLSDLDGLIESFASFCEE